MAEQVDNPSFFENLKQKYLDFIENLHARGVPSPQFLVPLVVLLVLAGVAFFAFPSVFSSSQSLQLTVRDTLGNPVPGATVAVFDATGRQLATKDTDSTGVASFSSVPANGYATITADRFEPTRFSFTGPTKSVSLRSTQSNNQQVQVKVLDVNGAPVTGAFVSLSFSNGDLVPQTETQADGVALLTVSQTQLAAATITVDSPGFQQAIQSVSEDELSTGRVITIQLSLAQRPANANGSLFVSLTESALPVAGVTVQLLDAVTSVELKSKQSAQDGTVEFEQVPYGKQLLLRTTDSSGVYASYNSPAPFDFSATTQPIAITLTKLAQTRVGTLTITAKTDATAGTPIQQATVAVFDATSNAQLATGETDAFGTYATTLGEGVTTYATVYADGFLPVFLSDLRAGSNAIAKLPTVSPGNNVEATVAVTQDGFPSANADVVLYRQGGYYLGIPAKRSGAEGTVAFTIPTQVNGAPYKVYAKSSKEELSGQSDLVDAGAEPFTLPVALIAKPANLSIEVKDAATNQLVAGGTVEVLVANAPVLSCELELGKCALVVKSGQEFSLHVTAPGYLSYLTSAKAYAAGEKANVSVKLFSVSTAQSATVTLAGLYDASGAKVRGLSNAETYTAKFITTMPQNVQQAGFYVRVGDETTAADSIAYITTYEPAGAQFVQTSTTFDSIASNSSCYSSNESSTPEAEKKLKWLYLAFPKGFVGSREINVKLQVARTAQSTDEVHLFYHAFGFKDNIPLLAPVDADALQTLRAKTDSGATLKPEDTCSAKTHEATYDVAGTLTCTNNETTNGPQVCYRAVFSDSASVGTASTFQPTIARQFKLDLDVLSDVAIDSLAVRTAHFKVSGSQTFAPKQTVSLATGDSTDSADVSTTSSALTPLVQKETNLAFAAFPNRKARASLTLTPTHVSQHAPLVVKLRTGANTIELPLALSITGTNTFSVSASPQQVNAVEKSTVIITVRDRLGQNVEDATVSLFECSGEPFSGNVPSDITGDGTSNNGQSGRYRFQFTPSGLGEIGVRVESPDFKPFESCLLTSVGKDFLAVDPETLEFTGNSNSLPAQQVTLTNKLSEPVRVSTSVNCGDTAPLKIFPSSATIQPSSDTQVSIRVAQNVTADTQCLATFTARAGTYVATQEIPIVVNVNCPGCVVTPGSASVPLPGFVTLYVNPLLMQDAVTIPLRLDADPTCRIDGFRVSSAGLYAQALGPQALYQTGVLAGLPQRALWSCDVCAPGATPGQSNCNMCQQVRPSAWQCGACSPASISAPTSSSLPVQGAATCNSCVNSFAAYQTSAFASPLAMYPQQFNPMVTQYGFSPAVGAPFRDQSAPDYRGLGAVPTSLPGSPFYPSAGGYTYATGFGPQAYGNGFGGLSPFGQGASYRNALVVEECTRDAITVAADYSFIGRVLPGKGNLYVTMPDGTRKTIMVNVLTPNSVVPGGTFPGQPLLAQQCGAYQSVVDVELSEKYKLKAKSVITLTCQTNFDVNSLELKIENGETLSPSLCTTTLATNELQLACDFSNNEKARAALDAGKRIIGTSTMSSSTSPGASIKIEFTLRNPTGPVMKERADRASASPAETAGGPAGDVLPPAGESADPALKPLPEIKLVAHRIGSSVNLCGSAVATGTDLIIDTTFPDGRDVPASRSGVVKKEGADGSWVEVKKLTTSKPKNSEKVNFAKDAGVKVQQYSVEASTTVPGFAVDVKPQYPCVIVVTDQPQYMDSITPLTTLWFEPVKDTLRDAPSVKISDLGDSFTIAGLDRISSAVSFNTKALYENYKDKELTLDVEYKCIGGTASLKPVLTSQYKVKLTSDSKVTVTTKSGALNSLLFAYCAKETGAVADYVVSAKLSSADGNVIETKFRGNLDSAVLTEKDAKPIRMYNSAEAPWIVGGADNPVPSNALPNLRADFAKIPLDGCGTFTGSDIAKVSLFRKGPGPNRYFIPLRNDYPVGQGTVLKYAMCFKGTLSTSPLPSANFNVELTDKTGALKQYSVPTKCQLKEVPGSRLNAAGQPVLPPTYYCESDEFALDGVLSPITTRANNIDLERPMYFYLAASTAERYYCKHWPALGDDQCKNDKVALKISKDDYSYEKICYRDSTNPNIVTCDLKTGSKLTLPNGFKFQATEVTDTAMEMKVTYPNADEDLSCDDLKFQNPKPVICTKGGFARVSGSLTEFVFATFERKVQAGERALDGFVVPLNTPTVRVKFQAWWSPERSWLGETDNNGLKAAYHYNFDHIDPTSGTLVGQPVKLVEPKVQLSTIMPLPGLLPSEGLYVMGDRDVAIIPRHITQYVGSTGNGKYLDYALFQLYDSTYGVKQDCDYGGNAAAHVLAAGGTAAGTVAGIAAFKGFAGTAAVGTLVPAAFTLGGAGIGAVIFGGGAVLYAIFDDKLLLGDSINSQESCDGSTMMPIAYANSMDATGTYPVCVWFVDDAHKDALDKLKAGGDIVKDVTKFCGPGFS